MKILSAFLLLFLAGCGGGGGDSGAAPAPTTTTTTLPSAGPKNCSDFATQHEAQAYFNANGGSASNNFDGLDANHDGVACQNLPP